MRVLYSRKMFAMLIGVLSILGYGVFVFAATGPFAPGEELNPSCAPGELNCYVEQLFATTNSTYTWIGNGSGQNGGSTDNTFFAGIGAGDGASNADYSNFIGTGAGTNAINANNSNFFGQSAGCNATNADNSNFFGQEAGCYATEANNSNFFGNSAGWTAVNAAYSTFFGDKAGYLAADATRSNFIGYNAGAYATGAYNSNLMGYRAGMGATNAHDSTFLGYEAGSGPCAGDPIGCELTVGAVNASNSVFMGYQAGYNTSGDVDFLDDVYSYGFGVGNVTYIGYQAGYNANYAVASTFVGGGAGYGATNALVSNFFGVNAGKGATNAAGSTFMGLFAGQDAINAGGSVFIGNQAGAVAEDAGSSIFMGNSAGANATNAFNSVFLGASSGESASDAMFSTFIGFDSGSGATHASNSIFLGHNAGWGAVNSANAIFIGSSAGLFGGGAGATTSSGTVTYSNLAGQFIVGEIVHDITNGISFYIFSDTGSIIETDTADTQGINPGDQLVGGKSGATATVDSTTTGSYSIVIGGQSAPFRYANSIVLGQSAGNTASNQFMVGSNLFRIDTMVFNGGTGNTCAIDTNTGITCSSDERLKTDIVELPSNTLDAINQLRTVTYKWNSGTETTDTHIGFIAQNIQEFFPELVTQNQDGMLSVNYANMTPILAEGIKELDIKISNIESIASDMNKSGLIAWFGDVANGIGDFFAGSLHAKHQICIDDVCVEKADFQKIINDRVSESYGYGYGQ